METSQLVELGVLGILTEEPADIATVRERLQHNFGRHWTAGYGALEPAFERLRCDDAIAVVPAAADRAGRPTYEVTDQGTDRLLGLLREPIADVADPAGRPALVLKLGFLHHLPREEQRAQLAALADQFEQARNRWIDLVETHEAAVTDPPGYRRELQELSIRLYDTYLEWLTEVGPEPRRQKG